MASPALRIGGPGDAAETDADRAAAEVMGMAGPPRTTGWAGESADRAPIRRAPSAGAALVTAPAAVGRVLQSPGHPLDAAARAFMEPRFGHDFSGVRVHTDVRAARAAASIRARAFTAGDGIVFGRGEYAPQTGAGRHLLAHELAHVVQQGGGAGLVQRQPAAAAESGAAPETVPAEVIDLLKLREGWRVDVYVDTEGHETAGMGHKLTAAEKALYAVGDTVPQETLNAWAQADAALAYAAATQQAATLGVTDARLVNALASVNFQLGTAWFREHTRTWAYLQAHDWENAAAEVQDSRWYSQTPTRVADFQAALRALPASPGAAAGAAPQVGAPIGTGTVTGSSLNVRTGPGATHEKTGTALPKGASVTIYARAGGWLCIGQGRWVSAEFVAETAAPAAPVAQGFGQLLKAGFSPLLPWLDRYLDLYAGGVRTDAAPAGTAATPAPLASTPAAPAPPVLSTLETLNAQIEAGKITFDGADERAELLTENTEGEKVTDRLQALVVHLANLQNIRISSVVRTSGHHGTGRAVDVGNEDVAGALLPPVATDATVASLGIDEIIFDARQAGETDPNKWNYDQGSRHDYGSATLDDHRDHIHFAVKAG